MPTYQYRCTECREPLEVVQSFTDAPLAQCPSCGGVLRKVFSAVGVVFKGSGFYQTDSRSAPKTESAAKDGDSAKSPAAATADGAKDAGGAKAEKSKAEKPPTNEKPTNKKEPSGSGSHKVA